MNQAFLRNLRDASLIKTIALPAAASTTVVTAAIDTGERTTRGQLPHGVEVILEIPALSATIIPDTRTATLYLEMHSTTGFATPDVIRSVVLTGAGGAGVSATQIRATLPEDSPRYVRGRVVFGASTTDGSAISATLALIPL